MCQSKRLPGRALAFGLMLAASFAVRAGSAPPAPGLEICLAEDNAPFSSTSGPSRGIDAEIVEELGRRLGRAVRLDWISVPNRGGLGRALGQSLVARQCDAFAGIPLGGELRADLAEKGLVASTPYLSTGYVLVQAPGRHLDAGSDLHGLSRIGAVTATPADLYLFKAGLHRAPYGNNRELVDALARGELEAGLVWAPALARLQADGVKLWSDALVPGVRLAGEMQTSFAVAVRADETALAAELDRTLAAMRSDGFVGRVAARYGLPESTASAAAR